MIARRYLVRIFSAGINNWFGDDPNIDQLAKAFKLDDHVHSVYEVANGQEECLAVAAHKLNEPKREPEAVSVLRISLDEPPKFGIDINPNEFGTTGIPQWDMRHRNLMANRDRILELVMHIVQQCQRGHDLVRRIEKPLVIRTINAILSYSIRHCPEHVKLVAEWCLSKKSTRENLSLDQIQGELMEVEFEDEAIRARAEQLSSGDLLKDWYSSVGELRLAYSAHYISEVKKRYGLR